MNSLVSTLRQIVALRTPAYEQFRDHKDAMRRGVMILLACALLAGIVNFAWRYVTSLRPINAEVAEQFNQNFSQSMELWQQLTPEQNTQVQAVMKTWTETMQRAFTMASDIDHLETPLPRGIARFFAALGGWVTGAFSHLGLWLMYSTVVLLLAKLMGGQGGLDRFFGLTALHAVPGLLGIFSIIPCAGMLLALVGWVWGMVIYVKAVQVSQRLSTGKAVLASLLPAVLLLVLWMISLTGFIAVIAGALGRG